MRFKDAFISGYEKEKARLAEEQEAKKAVAVADGLEKKKRKELAKQHHPTRQVKGFMSIDEHHKTWTVLNDKTYKGKAYQYSEIINIDVYEDNNQVTKGSIGSVVAGGVISGGIGAMLGGVVGPKKTQGTCDNLHIKITTNIIDTPIIYIEFISRPTKKNSSEYKDAVKKMDECYALLELITKENGDPINNESVASSSDPAEEIIKFKQLLDMGAITEEEYEVKKKQLLGI